MSGLRNLDLDAITAEEAKSRRARERRANARLWRLDPKLERALEIRASDPQAFDRLSSLTKMALGIYERVREAARAEGVEDAVALPPFPRPGARDESSGDE